jgi:hypothetical protein
MLAPKEKLSAKSITKLGLATSIAALWMIVVPIAGAAADVQISAARAAALKECNRLAAKSATVWPHDIRQTTGVTPTSICIGPAWPDMANKNDRQSASQ